MYLLINCDYDGDTYALFPQLDRAQAAFEESCKSGFYHHVYLLEPPLTGDDFGFGARGDLFGAHVIEEFEME